MTGAFFPVLDIGGTHVTAALADPRGIRVIHRATSALDAGADAGHILASLAEAAGKLKAGRDRTWGVAMPGPFDYVAGVGSFSGVDKFASLAGVDLRAALSAALRTGRDDVRFINDADAYALGEWDAQARPARLMCATLGTGVGGGFIERGRVVTDDPRVPSGGDFYHLTWRGEPLEDHVSRRAFLRDFGSPDLDVKDIARLALGGDAQAVELFARGMAVLADVIAPYIDAFRPDVLVVGGAIARSWALVGPPLRSSLTSLGTYVPDIRSARLHEEAPLIGAAEFARSSAPLQGKAMS